MCASQVPKGKETYQQDPVPRLSCNPLTDPCILPLPWVCPGQLQGSFAGGLRSRLRFSGRDELAFAEAALDEEEGADILMVKPAMPLHRATSFQVILPKHLPSTSWLRPYLDIIKGLHEQSNLPIAAYHAQPLCQGLMETSHGSHGSRSPENMPCSRLQLSMVRRSVSLGCYPHRCPSSLH